MRGGAGAGAARTGGVARLTRDRIVPTRVEQSPEASVLQNATIWHAVNVPVGPQGYMVQSPTRCMVLLAPLVMMPRGR